MSSRIAAIVAAAVLSLGLAAVPTAASAAPADCRTIPADADPVLKSDLARAEFGVDGTGVKVGIISNSYDMSHTTPAQHYSSPAENIADGLLPGAGNPCGYSQEVVLVRDMPAGQSAEFVTDEGRAMAQLVHAVAPGAQLYFASAGIGVEDVEGAIGLLQEQGVDVIVDDIISDSEPFYQQAPTSTKIAEVVDAGITYLSAAGNNTVVATDPLPGQEATPIGAWETTSFRPVDCGDAIDAQLGTLAAPYGYDCMDLDPGALEQPVLTYTVDTGELPSTTSELAAGGPVFDLAELELVMQWAEPFAGAGADFELFATTNITDIDLGTGTTGDLVAMPLEERIAGDPMRIGNVLFILDPADPDAQITLSLSIVRVTDSTDPATQIQPAIGFTSITDGYQWAVNSDRWRSEGTDTVGRSIVGHNGAPAAITVAASGAFDDDRVENFSSLGPVTYHFEPQVAGGPAASALPAPRVLQKPNILSVDGERQNVIDGAATGTPGIFAFDGTSAATPTAGAVVALALQLNPALTPAQVHELLAKTATPIPAPYPTIAAENSVGAGLIDAQALLYEVDATLPVPDPGSHTGRPVLASSGGTDAAPAVVAGAALLLLGGALVTVRRRRAAR